ncbi:DUF2497 domain-containing protein [Xanthobacter sediminis]
MQEPSMEEILDSIRRIIADDDPADAEPPFSPPRPMAPARRPVAGYGQRPAAPQPVDRRGAGPQRLYGRVPDGAGAVPVDEPPYGDAPHGDGAPYASPEPEVRPVTPPRQGERSFAPDHGDVRGAAAPNRREDTQVNPAIAPAADLRPSAPRNAPSPAAGGQVRPAAARPAWEAEAPVQVDVVRESLRGEAASAAFDRPPLVIGEDRRQSFSGSVEAPRGYAAAPRPVSDLPPVRAPLAADSETAAVFPPAAEAPPAERRVEAAPANRPAAAPAAATAAERRTSLPRKDLLSPAVDAAVAAAFKSLGDLVLPQQERTVEDLVKEILRPMLKEWLDQHLTGIVERLVRAEIERVTSTLR